MVQVAIAKHDMGSDGNWRAAPSHFLSAPRPVLLGKVVVLLRSASHGDLWLKPALQVRHQEGRGRGRCAVQSSCARDATRQQLDAADRDGQVTLPYLLLIVRKRLPLLANLLVYN